MNDVIPESRDNAYGGCALIYHDRNLSLVVHLRADHNVPRNLIVVDIARAPVLTLSSQSAVTLHNEEGLREMYKKDERIFHYIRRKAVAHEQNVGQFVDAVKRLANRNDYSVEPH